MKISITFERKTVFEIGELYAYFDAENMLQYIVICTKYNSAGMFGGTVLYSKYEGTKVGQNYQNFDCNTMVDFKGKLEFDCTDGVEDDENYLMAE